MTPTETRAALFELQLHPSRTLGQNFLIDANIVRLTVAAADLGPDDLVLEIGPGLGALTEMLVERAGRVVAVEKDGRLYEFLTKRFRDRSNLQLIHGDALEFDFESIAPTRQGASPQSVFKVVANLPYAISSPLLHRLVESPKRPSTMLLMLQREVGDRLTAQPRTKEYGALTLFTQLYYQVHREHLVSKRCFIPPPAIESAILAFHLAPHPLLEPAVEAPFKELVRAGFAHRRKMLRGLLPKSELSLSVQSAQLTASLERLGLPATARGEELNLAQWLQLTRDMVHATLNQPPTT